MDHIDIVFDGPPSHESGRFVEVENAAGASINFGEWVERADGFWALRIPAPSLTAADMTMGAFVAELAALQVLLRERAPDGTVTAVVDPVPGEWRIAVLMRFGSIYVDAKISRGVTAAVALGAAREIIEAHPRPWTAADVAATIGLPICDLCDEAVATHDLTENPYDGHAPSERVCEPCLEKAWDRQNERAMEG